MLAQIVVFAAFPVERVALQRFSIALGNSIVRDLLSPSLFTRLIAPYKCTTSNLNHLLEAEFFSHDVRQGLACQVFFQVVAEELDQTRKSTL